MVTFAVFDQLGRITNAGQRIDVICEVAICSFECLTERGNLHWSGEPIVFAENYTMASSSPATRVFWARSRSGSG